MIKKPMKFSLTAVILLLFLERSFPALGRFIFAVLLTVWLVLLLISVVQLLEDLIGWRYDTLCLQTNETFVQWRTRMRKDAQ